MPKRSNDFQRLVYLVRLNLAEGAEVAESTMMRDRLTKRFREVDVVIKGRVGSQPVVVCIECRDQKRVADVGWVDAMKAKHERLNTHALLLASSKGFTKEAEDVARKYGIELFTLEKQEGADLAQLIGPTGSLWHKTSSLSVDKVRIRVAIAEDLPVETVVTSPDNLLYLEGGVEFCQVKELVELLLKTEHMRQYFVREGKEEHVRFELIWEPPVDLTGRPFYMQKLEPKAFRAVESIRITGPCTFQIGRFDFQQGHLGSVQVAWGKASIAGRDAMAVARDESGKTKFSVSLKGSVRSTEVRPASPEDAASVPKMGTFTISAT